MPDIQEEEDFPRGGASLTPLEARKIRSAAEKDALFSEVWNIFNIFEVCFNVLLNIFKSSYSISTEQSMHTLKGNKIVYLVNIILYVS